MAETTITLDYAPQEAFKIVAEAVSQVEDIKNTDLYESVLTIHAHTEANTKTYGDDIVIKISEKEGKSSVRISSTTEGQITDWGRNKQNIEHILSQIGMLTNQDAVHDTIQNASVSESPQASGGNWVWKAIGAAGIILLLLYWDGVFDSFFSHDTSSYSSSSYDVSDDDYNSYSSSSSSSSEADIIGSWKHYNGDPYGQCLFEVVNFGSNGRGSMRSEYYSGGNRIVGGQYQPSSFSFSYSVSGNNVIIEGSVEFTYSNGTLRDASGNVFKRGSNFLY